MGPFIVRRLLQLPLILAVVFVVTFVLAWVIPGNPLESEDRRPPPEIAEAMLRQYNLHSPWAFARSYATNLLTRGQLGPSLYYQNRSVNDLIRTGLPVSAALGAAALVVALVIGLGAGALGAMKPGSWADHATLGLAVIGVSLPTFVTASVLVVLFAGVLRWLPHRGLDTPAHFILPAITLAALPAAYIARLFRLGLADVMNQDFIRTARAKGLSRNQALYRHAFKVAFLPVLSYLGPAAAVTLTGSFVVELVFDIDGMGEHFVNAVQNKDQFLILGVVLTYSTILILFNLVVDVAYAWVDPRIELS